MLIQPLYELMDKIENHKFYRTALLFAQCYATYLVVFLIPQLPLYDNRNP